MTVEIYLDTTKPESYDLFLKIKALPRYRFQGSVAIVDEEYLPLLGGPVPERVVNRSDFFGPVRSEEEYRKDKKRRYLANYYQNNKDKFAKYRDGGRAKRNADRRERYRTDEAFRLEVIAKTKAYNERNPFTRRNNSLQKNYGISLAEYDAMLSRQKGKCAICGKGHTAKRRLAVDHCHKTGAVRGILCIQCNHGLGNFRDDPAMMRKAIKYLAKSLKNSPDGSDPDAPLGESQK